MKCGFNLKGAAAPKFKGTMLMTNQPPQAPGARPPGPPGPGGPPPGGPPPGPPQPPQGLAGTVIGVPPAGLGAGAMPGGPPPGPPAPGGDGTAPPAPPG